MKIEDLNKNDKMVLAQNTTNRELLGILAKENDEDIKYQIAGNENTPIEILNNLKLNHIYVEALNENYSFQKYRELMNDESFSKMELIKQEAIIKMFRMIDNKEDISIDQYNIFMKMDYNHLLNKIASYEKTPHEILKNIYDSKSYIVDYTLAKNPNCPQNILEELAKRKDYFLNLKLAVNPNCPQNILEELAKINDEVTNLELASNPNTPIKILEQLANHEYEEIRINLVCNKNCSKEILEQLSKDESLNVKDYIPINPNVTREILESMSNDPNNVKELIDRCNRYLKRLDKKEQSNDYDFER